MRTVRPIVGGRGSTRAGMMKRVNVRLDRFGQEALEEHLHATGESEGDVLDVAVRYYLGDADTDRLAWKVPRKMTRADPEEEVELELDDGLHGELRREARRQHVSPDMLAMHALMYYLADTDSGKAAARLGDAINRDAEA
jgi:hypothetical protein